MLVKSTPVFCNTWDKNMTGNKNKISSSSSCSSSLTSCHIFFKDRENRQSKMTCANEFSLEEKKISRYYRYMRIYKIMRDQCMDKKANFKLNYKPNFIKKLQIRPKYQETILQKNFFTKNKIFHFLLQS